MGGKRTMVKSVEIEIDGQHNEALHFRPLQRNIRGRFDLMRIGEPMAKVKASEWPVPIPSQRLGIDRDGTGYILEPLHEAEFAPLREKIEGQGMRLEPKLQEFDGVHLPSWLFWIKRAVESGLAKIVNGELPLTIEGEPVKNFVIGKREDSPVDKLTAAIERQNVLFEKLLARLADDK
jgi:hypothetical protein